MYYADTAFMGCYNLRCSLGKGSSNKAFRHWGGAMIKLFWPRFLASLGNENRLKNIDFILTGQFASALAYLQTSAVIVRSAKHDVTIFGRKSDKTALCAEILQSLRSFRMTESVTNNISCHPEGRSPRKDLMQSIRDYVVNAVQKNRYPNNTKDLYARFGAQDDNVNQSLRGATATKQSKKIAALITFARNDSILTDDSLTVANDNIKIDTVYSSEECYDEVN